jgi:REP element-mobilizing transposase RayT
MAFHNASEESIHFHGKYRIPSTRLPGWDYGGLGKYFITICTKPRLPWFGQVRNKHMHLSREGQIIDTCWRFIPALYPHITLDAHIVMPDHFHGIVIIDWPDDSVYYHSIDENASWKSGCLGVIINQFKGICTKRIRKTGNDEFLWQPRYHDRIIRDPDDMNRVRRYTQQNPANWKYGRNDTSVPGDGVV